MGSGVSLLAQGSFKWTQGLVKKKNKTGPNIPKELLALEKKKTNGPR